MTNQPTLFLVTHLFHDYEESDSNEMVAVSYEEARSYILSEAGVSDFTMVPHADSYCQWNIETLVPGCRPQRLASFHLSKDKTKGSWWTDKNGWESVDGSDGV